MTAAKKLIADGAEASSDSNIARVSCWGETDHASNPEKCQNLNYFYWVREEAHWWSKATGFHSRWGSDTIDFYYHLQSDVCLHMWRPETFPIITFTNSQMQAEMPRGTRPPFSLRWFWQSEAWGHHPQGSWRKQSQPSGAQRGVTAVTAPNRKHLPIWITLDL